MEVCDCADEDAVWSPDSASHAQTQAPALKVSLPSDLMPLLPDEISAAGGSTRCVTDKHFSSVVYLVEDM